MNDISQGMITRLLTSRKVLIELILATVFLAFSINLISSSLIELNLIPPLWTLIFASFLALVFTVYFVIRILFFRSYVHLFEGFFIYNSDKNSVINVERYDYGGATLSVSTKCIC